MIKGKTRSGFSFEIPDENIDNMELLDAFAELDGDDFSAMPKVSLLLLGKEQKKALYAHLRTEKGNVPPEAFGEDIGDIFKAIGEQEKNF